MLNDGEGNFGDPVHTFGFSHRVAVGDMDNDGDLDLVFQYGHVWLNNGNAQFSIGFGGSLSNSLEVELADLNGDGYLDGIFSRNFCPTNPLIYALQRWDGAFNSCQHN